MIPSNGGDARSEIGNIAAATCKWKEKKRFCVGVELNTGVFIQQTKISPDSAY